MTTRLFPTKVFISVDEAASAGFFNTHSVDGSSPASSVEDIISTNNKRKVFDCRFSLEDPLNYGRKQYLEKGRLPNAIFVDLDAEMSGDLHNTTARHPLPEAKDFITKVLMKAGIGIGGKTSFSSSSNSTACLCYDDCSGGLAAARMWWMLNNLGIEAYILDGGIQYYKVESEYTGTQKTLARNEGVSPFPLPLISSNFPNVVTKELPMPSASTVAVDALLRQWPHKLEWSHVVDGQTVKSLYFENKDGLKPNDIPLYVDARFSHRFGSCTRPFGGDKFAGGVPFSVNRPWNANIAPPSAAVTTAEMSSSHGSTSSINDDESIDVKKDDPSLRKLLSKVPVVRPTAALRSELMSLLPTGKSNFNDAIFSCASGVTACFNIAVANHVGLGTPVLYAGAWNIEGVNRAYLADRSHSTNGYRLEMIKKIPGPQMGTRVTNPDTELKVTRVAPVRCLSFSRLHQELTAKVGKELYLGEIADVYVKDDSNPKEMLVGRIEAVKAGPSSKL